MSESDDQQIQQSEQWLLLLEVANHSFVHADKSDKSDKSEPSAETAVFKDWPKLQTLLRQRFDQIVASVLDEEVIKEARPIIDRINAQLDDFKETPWTIQRLCELMVDPEKHYHNFFKFLRAVEKQLFIITGAKEFDIVGKETKATTESEEEDLPPPPKRGRIPSLSVSINAAPVLVENTLDESVIRDGTDVMITSPPVASTAVDDLMDTSR